MFPMAQMHHQNVWQQNIGWKQNEGKICSLTPDHCFVSETHYSYGMNRSQKLHLCLRREVELRKLLTSAYVPAYREIHAGIL